METKQELRYTITRLRYGSDSIENRSLAFKCIQKAIAFKDFDLEFMARYAYLKQSIFLDQYEDAIAQYPWFLNALDKHPEKIEEWDVHSILWAFKWVISAIPYYHKISLAQINALFQEFETRFRDNKAGEKVILYFKMQQQAILGHPDKAIASFTQYRKMRTSRSLDDCKACQINCSLDVLLLAQDYPTFLKYAKPILKRKHTCGEVPKTTYPKASVVAWLSGKTADAENYAQLGYKKIPFKQPRVSETSYLWLFYAMTKGWVRGRKLVEQQLGFILQTSADFNSMHAYFGGKLFFQAMQKAGKKTVKLKLGDSIKTGQFLLPLPDKADTYNLQMVIDWFEQKTNHRIGLLDKRNQNTFYQGYFESFAAKVEVASDKPSKSI